MTTTANDIYRVESPRRRQDFDTYAQAREVFQRYVSDDDAWVEVWEISGWQAVRRCTFTMGR